MKATVEEVLDRVLCTWACLDNNRCACERTDEVIDALRKAGFEITPIPAERTCTIEAVEVRKNEKGAWCVLLDGVAVSSHRTHEAARIAAQGHLRVTT